MSKISTHVLDTVTGRPAAGIAVQLDRMLGGVMWSAKGERTDAAEWIMIATGATDPDGRCSALKQDAPDGWYRLTFNVGDYFKSLGRTSIYPEIAIIFECDGASHYHLPMLLSENCHTTYRGS
jgi:5-hydroxyisourate hydrolase